MKSTNSSSSRLWLFLFAQIVIYLDFQTITLYFTTFSETFNVEYDHVAILISIYSICILFSPIFGSLSDQYGRKGFLTIGLVIFVISSVIMAGAQNWTHIILSRALAGLANAIFLPTLFALLGDEYTSKRARAMGFVRLAWPITFIFGMPLIGYSIEFLNWRLPFMIMTLVAIFTGIIINLMSFSSVKSEKTGLPEKPRKELFKTVLLDKNAVSGLLMMSLAVGAIQGIFVLFPTWMESEFQLGESTISIIYAFMGVGTLFGTLLATWIGDDFGPKQCAVIGLSASAGCMILLSHFSFNPIFVIIWLLFLGTSFDLSVTVRPVLLTQITPGAKGTIISLNRAFNAGATAISAALSGFLWLNYGYTSIGLVFAFIALIGAIVGIFGINITFEASSNKTKNSYNHS